MPSSHPRLSNTDWIPVLAWVALSWGEGSLLGGLTMTAGPVQAEVAGERTPGSSRLACVKSSMSCGLWSMSTHISAHASLAIDCAETCREYISLTCACSKDMQSMPKGSRVQKLLN